MAIRPGAREARAAAERAVRLDSTDATFVSQLTWLTLAAGDSAGLDGLLKRLRSLDTTTMMVRGDMRGIEAVRLNDAQFAPDGRPDQRGIDLRVDINPAGRAHIPSGARRSDRTAIARVTAVANRRTGLGALAQVLASEGRWQTIDSLRQSGAFQAAAGFERLVDRLTVAASIAGVADEAAAQRAVAALAAKMPPDSALALFERAPVWHEGWLIGAWNAMYGDTLLARRWDAAIGTFPRGGSPPEYKGALRADIQSRLAARRGDRRTALAAAGRAFELWSIHTGNASEVMPEPAMRFQLASLLRATGNSDSAATLFRSMIPPNTWQGFYTARAALEAGELADARGDRAFAEHEFLTALRLWERGDSVVAQLRDRARRGLARDRS